MTTNTRTDYSLDNNWLSGTYTITAEVVPPVGPRVDTVIATFTDKDAATTAWYQVMACSAAEPGTRHLASKERRWHIQWFNQTLFEVESTTATTQGEKNETVMVLVREGAPVKVEEYEIEHWTENPLFAL